MSESTTTPQDEATLEAAVNTARKDVIIRQGKFNKLSEQYTKAASDLDEANRTFQAANKALHNFIAEQNKQ